DFRFAIEESISRCGPDRARVRIANQDLKSKIAQMDLSKVVSAGVGPIVVISACSLLCSTFYNRMTNVITRLRAFQRERMAEQALLDRETDDAFRARRQELLTVLHTQTDSLIRRVRLIRKTLFSLLGTIAALVFCSMSLGL